MAMNPTQWGTAVAAAVKGVGVEAGTPITDEQLQAIWIAIKTEDDNHISANAQVTVTVEGVQSGGSTASGTGTVT